MKTAALAVLAGLAGATAAHAATCPSTCVTFDDAADAEAFVGMVSGASADDAAAFLKARMAKHAARTLPAGTQFVLLGEHKVEAAKSAYYAVHLPGGMATLYLVAVK